MIPASRSNRTSGLIDLSKEETVLISSITAFEIGIKHSKNLLQLPYPPDEWYDRLLTYHSLEEYPISGKPLLSATSLPKIHHDPCDRIIAATAIYLGATIITADPVFLKYGIATRL